MKYLLHNAGKQEETWYPERCFIREIVNTPNISEFSLAETRVEPGVTTQLHTLDVKEWYIVLSGNGLMEVGSTPGQEVVPGDVVEIPPGVAQRITNTGNADLVFQCLCLPRFTPACYQSLEKQD